MKFSHDKSWDCLTAILATKDIAVEGWHKFIDLHAQEIPKPYWALLKQIPLELEQTDLTDWLHQLATDNPIQDDVVALWIGMIKLSEGKKETPAIYMIGAGSYNPDDVEWACDPTYLPDDRYVAPSALQIIDDIAKTDKDNYQFLDWILPLAYCTLTFDEIIRKRLDRDLFLKHKNRLHVALGFDSGDYMCLSDIE